jgi:acetyltransferase EpsM
MKILLIGGGGFSREICEVAKLNGHIIIGYVSDIERNINLKYLGKFSEIENIRNLFECAFFSLGAVDRDSLEQRKKLIESLFGNNKLKQISLISPHSVISSDVTIGCGVFVGHGAVLAVGAKVGDNSIININAVVGHDTQIGSNVVVGPGALIAGNVVIQDSVLIGMGANISQSLEIGNNSVISSGSLVMRNIKSGSTTIPNLSRVIK